MCRKLGLFFSFLCLCSALMVLSTRSSADDCPNQAVDTDILCPSQDFFDTNTVTSCEDMDEGDCGLWGIMTLRVYNTVLTKSQAGSMTELSTKKQSETRTGPPEPLLKACYTRQSCKYDPQAQKCKFDSSTVVFQHHYATKDCPPP